MSTIHIVPKASTRWIIVVISLLTLLLLQGPVVLGPVLRAIQPYALLCLSNPTLFWRHVLADLLTAGAYLMISGMLVYLVHRARHAIPFQGMF